MQLIRCTKKLRKEMGLKAGDLEAETPSEWELGGWHANLIYIDRRKCVLFANNQTLLNFLIPDLSRAQIRKLSGLFRDHLLKMLAEEELDQKKRTAIIDACQQIRYASSNSRSVLGSMNDLAYHYKFHILRQGGLEACDMSKLIMRLNRMPMGAVDYQLPVEAFLEAI